MFAKGGLLHIALIKFRPGTPQEVQEKIYGLYQTLDQDCGGEAAGIHSWRVDWNMDMRKNVQLVQVSEFRDTDALQAFRAHPKHAAVTDILREVADWQVGDIIA